MKGKTDWAAVDALTDEEITQAVANDPVNSNSEHIADALSGYPDARCHKMENSPSPFG